VSRTLKRPMFRRGGSTNNGIMTGLKDRQKYSLGARVEEITAAMDKYAPIQKTRLPIGQLGLNLASGKFAGDGFLQNLIGSLQDPYASFVKADDARKTALDKRKASAVGVAIAEQSAKDLAKIKAKSKDFYAAQTPEEQFKVRSKIYSENKIPQIRDNASNLAMFEIRHRDKPYVQLSFVYSGKTKKFEPQFNNVPDGAITYNPADGKAYKRKGDKFIELNPFNLEPIENVDGTE
jgi:hypothetical protein